MAPRTLSMNVQMQVMKFPPTRCSKGSKEGSSRESTRCQ